MIKIELSIEDIITEGDAVPLQKKVRWIQEELKASLIGNKKEVFRLLEDMYDTVGKLSVKEKMSLEKYIKFTIKSVTAHKYPPREVYEELMLKVTGTFILTYKKGMIERDSKKFEDVTLNVIVNEETRRNLGLEYQ